MIFTIFVSDQFCNVLFRGITSFITSDILDYEVCFYSYTPCVLALYILGTFPSCENKKSQAYYSGGIQTHDLCILEQCHYQLINIYQRQWTLLVITHLLVKLRVHTINLMWWEEYRISFRPRGAHSGEPLPRANWTITHPLVVMSCTSDQGPIS